MSLNVMDWAIVLSLLFFIFRGFRSGFVQQLFGLFGTILALVLAFHYYDDLGKALADWLRVSENLGNILGFILLAVGVSAIMGFLGARWKEYTGTSSLSVIDGIAGALFGAVKILLVWVIILLIISSVQWEVLQKPFYESELAEDVLKLVPFFYFLQDQALPANVPRLFITPEGVQLRRLKYEDLDYSTCISCGGVVRFEGMAKKGLFYFPLFRCTSCGRTSDGCQTYEGYHHYYRRCPWDGKTPLAGTNCPVWPNPSPAFPTIPCPYCGKYQTEDYPQMTREIIVREGSMVGGSNYFDHPSTRNLLRRLDDSKTDGQTGAGGTQPF